MLDKARNDVTAESTCCSKNSSTHVIFGSMEVYAYLSQQSRKTVIKSFTGHEPIAEWYHDNKRQLDRSPSCGVAEKCPL
jgi:hypothetical protein